MVVVGVKTGQSMRIAFADDPAGQTCYVAHKIGELTSEFLLTPAVSWVE